MGAILPDLTLGARHNPSRFFSRSAYAVHARDGLIIVLVRDDDWQNRFERSTLGTGVSPITTMSTFLMHSGFALILR